jgi:hypothetical protein
MQRSRRDLLRAGIGAGAAVLGGCTAPPHRNAEWSNNLWTRCIDPDRMTAPGTLAEIVGAVRDAAKGAYRIRAVGSGHSFSDISFADGHILSFKKLAHPLDLDPARLDAAYQRADAPPLVAVEAGISVHALNQTLASRHLALKNMGGWDEQSVGGVVSTATHGSGLDFGSFSSCVRSLVVVAQDGRVLQIEPRDGITDSKRFEGVTTPTGLYKPAELIQDDDVFNAVVVGVGSLGVIYSAVLEVEKEYWLHEVRELTSWEELTRPSAGFLAQLAATGAPPPQQGVDAKGETPRNYEIWVNPYETRGLHGAVLVQRFRRATPPPAGECARRDELWLRLVQAFGIAFPRAVTDFIDIDPAGIGAQLELGFDGLVGRTERHCCLDGPSYAVFNAGDTNRLRALSVEPAVQLKQAIPAMEYLHQIVAYNIANRRGVNAGPISLRFVKGSSAFLDPHFGDGPVATLEIQSLVGVRHMEATLREEEWALMRNFHARPHWGLDFDAIQGEATLRALYPRYEDWKRQFQRLNSAGVFNNQFTDRVGLSSNIAAPAGKRFWDDCRR